MIRILAVVFLIILVFKYSHKLPFPKVIYYILIGTLMAPLFQGGRVPLLSKLSPYIRQLSLIIILLRTGFSLNLKDIKKIGIPALLMSFVPAIFEIITVTFLAPYLFNISYLDAALLGSILAAVSPAIVIPNMIGVIDEGLGQVRKVPHLILAGASLDDIFAIVVFESLLNISLSADAPLKTVVQLPGKLVLGIFLGFLLGFVLKNILNRLKFQKYMHALIILITGILLIALETRFSYSGLLSIMVMGFVLMHENSNRTKMQGVYTKLWSGMEVLLFTIVGAGVTFSSFSDVGIKGLLLLFTALIIRSLGVFISLLISDLNFKEKLFAMLSYTPKATVQAALGSIPLSVGLASGNLILSMSVIAILITAPMGAILIQKTKGILLK